MSRALVIKGADFSAVKIEDVAIDGRKYLTRSNPLFIKNGYISYGTKLWVDSIDTQTYFWPVSEGDYLVSRGNMSYKAIESYFYFVIIENSIPIFKKIGGCIIGDKNFIISQAPTDGYVAIIISDGVNIVDIPETFITSNIDAELMNDLKIIKEHKVHDISGYLKSDGTWGSGAHSYSFPVFKGEQLIITASANGAALVGLYSKSLATNNQGAISYSSMNKQNNMDEIADGVKRIYISSGESQNITIPNDGYIVFESLDGSVSPIDVFPESIHITIE